MSRPLAPTRAVRQEPGGGVVRPMAVRYVPVVLLLPLLVACSLSSTGANETRAEPPGAVQATNSRGEPAVSAAWIDPRSIAVTTWGSSSCATRPVRIERTDEQEVEVRVRRTERGRDCTADAAPTTNQVVLPEGVSKDGPLDVVIDADGGTDYRLKLDPP
jgi:hypothetical protein